MAANRYPRFAVETLRRWWWQMGVNRYRAATDLLMTADEGAENPLSYLLTLP